MKKKGVNIAQQMLKSTSLICETDGDNRFRKNQTN